MKFDTKFSGRIIQLVDSLDYGDAVSGQIIAIDVALREMSFDTGIYTHYYGSEVSHCRNDLAALRLTDRDIIIWHFSGRSDYVAKVALATNVARILLYHNITPEKFFEAGSPLYAYCKQGREQLREIIPKCHLFWGDSKFNINELIELGADSKKCRVLPILVQKKSKQIANEDEREAGSWLFVGRIVANKRQDELVRIFGLVRNKAPELAQSLTLIGGGQDGDVFARGVESRIREEGLEGCVKLTGKISDEEKEAIYLRSSIFVSASEHEGFGVPLVEASQHGLPVVALAGTAVDETIGGGKGLANDSLALAELAIEVLTSKQTRDQLVLAQRSNAKRFEMAAFRQSLQIALENVVPKERQFKSVSVVICTYNRLYYLERVINYLRYQTRSDFEVIIVDGPSDDGTKKFIASIQSDVKILHNPERNLSISRNIGIQAASGDIVAFIDDDAIPFDDWIENILNEYNRQSMLTAGIGGPVFYAGTLKYQCEDIAFNDEAVTHVNVSPEKVDGDVWYRSLLGTNSTFSRNKLLEIGGFDEEYDYFLDETDLCLRLQRNGGIILYSKNINLRHEFAESENRNGKYKYNWFSISKNTAYFVGLHSSVPRSEIFQHLQNKMEAERIAHLRVGRDNGELSSEDFERFHADINRGVKRGIEDLDASPKTRVQFSEPDKFKPFYNSACDLRVSRDIKRLHICIVSKEFTHFGERGGIGTLYYNLASELILMGHKVTVVIQSNEKSDYTQGPFRVLKFKPSVLGGDLLYGAFKPILENGMSALQIVAELHLSEPIDVVDSALWDVEAFPLAMIDKKNRPAVVCRLVTPFLIAADTNGWNLDSKEAALIVGAERALIDHADAVIPISVAIEKSICEKYEKTPDERWVRIYCGISYWPHFDVNSGYGEFQDYENIPAEKFGGSRIILFIGRLERRKGVDILLHAANRFMRSAEDLILVLAGRDVENFSGKIEYFIDADLRDRVHFLGEVANATKDKLLAKAYCLAFPSRYESFGLVPLEAFVHSLPVIGARAGAIPEVIRHEVDGILVDVDDPASLAKAVERLASDPDLHAALALGAHDRVRMLSSRRMASASVRVYKRVVREIEFHQ